MYEYQQEYYQRNRDKILAKAKQKYIENKKNKVNKQKINKTESEDYFKEYYQKNKNTSIFMKGKCRQKTKKIERNLEKLKQKSDAFKKSLQINN